MVSEIKQNFAACSTDIYGYKPFPANRKKMKLSTRQQITLFYNLITIKARTL